jgi:hypothetical protein
MPMSGLGQAIASVTEDGLHPLPEGLIYQHIFLGATG